MSTIVGFLELLVVCGTLLGIAFMICAALPQSPFKDMVTKIALWGVAVAAGVYCISPVDLLPEAMLGPAGIFDDVAALILAVCAAREASKSGKAVPAIGLRMPKQSRIDAGESTASAS